jgi:hypothetical protein
MPLGPTRAIKRAPEVLVVGVDRLEVILLGPEVAAVVDSVVMAELTIILEPSIMAAWMLRVVSATSMVVLVVVVVTIVLPIIITM